MKLWCLVSVDPWVSSFVFCLMHELSGLGMLCVCIRGLEAHYGLWTLCWTPWKFASLFQSRWENRSTRLRSQKACYKVVLLGRNLWAQPEKSHKVLWCRRGWLQIIRAQRCHSDLYPGSLSSRRCSCNCLAARLGSMHSCPSPNKHTYNTVQKTRNLNCIVGGNVNGTAMLENKMEVP